MQAIPHNYSVISFLLSTQFSYQTGRGCVELVQKHLMMLQYPLHPTLWLTISRLFTYSLLMIFITISLSAYYIDKDTQNYSPALIKLTITCVIISRGLKGTVELVCHGAEQAYRPSCVLSFKFITEGKY